MRSVLLLITLAASALAGPTGQRQTCALHCTEADLFSYYTGKSYVYQYSVTTSTALLGTFDDDARMHITANAHIDVTAPCEYTLRLTEVTLEGSSHAEEFAAAITKSPLRFSFQDGRVESVCSEVSEPAWVLNIKRGVLSTFQNSMTRQVKGDVQETDISGVCVTHYKSLMEGNVMTVEKVKDLSSCTERPELAAYIASKPYDTDSPVQSLPIFKSTHKCNQRIEEGILKTAECEEIHKYRPFSSDEGGAVTTVKTTMSLVSMDGTALPVTDYQFISKSLVFEQTATSKPEIQVEVIEKILNDLETAANDEIRPEVPALFSTLVASLKDLNYPTLSAVYTNTRHRHSRKFLLDAMPLVGTAASVGVVKDMFLNGDMTKADGNIWFSSLAFLKNPTSDMFTAIAPLLENNPSQEAMLGISAMVNTYCKIKPDCTADQGVRQVLRRIETQLGYDCRAVNEEEKMKVLVALKALGNAGHWVNANGILRQCYTEDNAMEVRVAAIEAWRHTPCEYDRSNLLAAFQDETQDSEVRIAAYLAVMTCPTQIVINTIKDRLTSEGVNQVGSFIWTHLTNMQESAAPGKQWAREMIGEELLQKKFRTDALKFSRNYESSFFMNELNAGAAVESNVIFSSKSYLPRSAMLNLTLDLFGESINLFEFGGRIEGFEAYVERFFGPNGYFPEETIEGIIRNMRQAKPDAEATTLEEILDKVTDEPEGSYFLRVFGNELYYNHFHGLEELMESTGASNPLEVLMDLAREGEVDYTKSHQLIDTHYSIPTVSGLPVTLTAQGTATLALRMNGTFEAENLKNINIEGYFHPSAAVQMDGLMVVDAHITRTGLKISSTLQTSTFLDGRVKIQEGKLADIAFNTPRDKIEVIDVKTKFFFLEGDQEVQQEPEAMVEYEGCTSGISGIALCGELSYTPSSPSSPIFPLSGPAAAHIYFKKTDTQSAYILRFTREENGIALLLDTPESQGDHRISLAIMKAEKEIHIDLRTPFKSLQGNVEYAWRKNDRHITFDLMVDESDRYKVGAGIKTSGNRVMTIEPHLFLTSPRGEILNVVGTLQANARDAKYGADITVSEVTHSPIIFHASYDREENSADVKVMMETPIFEINGNGRLRREDNSVITKAEVEYSVFGGNKHMIKHSGIIRKDMTEDAIAYLVNFELNPTQFADRALAINLRNLISIGHVESKCTITYGPVTWNLEKLWSYNNRNNHRDFNVRLVVDCPYHGIDFLISKEFKIGRNYLTGESQVRLAPGKDYSLKAELSGREDREVIGRIDTQIEDAKATAEVHFNKIARGHYTVQVTGNALIRGEERTWILEGTLKNKSAPSNFNVNTEGSFKSQTNEITFSSDIYADEETARIDFRSNVNNRKMTVMMEGTRTSITVDTNIYRHILVNSYIRTDGETRSVVVSAEWDKDVDPTKSFVMNGQLSPTGVQADFKYGETKMSASGKMIDNEVEMEAVWAPNKRVLARVHYSLDDTKSLAATVETPLPGWEKQDATFTVSVKDYEITSRAAVIWKNKEQMSLAINGKLQPGLLNNAMNTKVIFSSNIESLEHISFILDHNMAETTINTNINGLWNDSEMKGNFHVTPTENGVDASATFISPFTEEILVTLHHEFVDTALSTSLEAKYGTEVSTLTLMGQIETGEVQTSTLEFKIITPTTIVPEIDGNIKYTYDGTHLALVTEGKVGEKKMMLNVNGEKIITEDSTAITGDLRFITPFTSPVNLSLLHKYDGQMFTSQFEMTGVWSTFGNVKMHAKGHVISTNDIVFIATISSPVTKASFSFGHKIANNNLSSSVDATVNGERFSVTLNGDIDTPNGITNLEGEVTSTYSGMDNINVKIESKKDGNTRTSKAILVKGTKSLNIDHTLSYYNLLNWENSLNVNGKYKLRNKLTHSGTPLVYEMEYTRESETVYVKGTVDPRISEESRKIDAQVIVTTPWEYFENIKIDLHHEDDGVEYNPIIKIEYLSENIFEFATLIKFVAPSFYIASNLTTPFWQPLGYQLNLDLQTRKAVVLTFNHGTNETKFNINGNWDQGKLEGYLEIHSSCLRVPVLVEASYDITLPEKTFHLSVSLDKKYEITGSFSGHLKNAKWFLATDLPTEAANHIEFNGEYNTTNFPFTVSTALKLNSNIYEVTGKIDPKEFLINMNINGKKGSLSGQWVFNHTHVNIQAHFQSPVNESDNLTAYIMYDFENNMGNVKFIRGTQHMNLTGMLEGETLVFEGTTPFSGWENLNASFFISKPAISASVSRNNNRIELNGTMDIKRNDGKIGLTITTPYINYETVSFETIYNSQDKLKTIEMKSTFGREELSLKGVVRLTDPVSPEIDLRIITPFEVTKTVGVKARWNLQDAVKSAEIQAYRNDLRFSWQLEAAAESPLKGYASCKITTTLRGWTAVSVKGNFDFSAMPYNAVFVYDKEGVLKKFEGNLSITENAITGDLITPITRWEKLNLNGTYNFKNNHLTGNLEFNKESEKYEVSCDILFHTQTPKLHIEIMTPLTFAAKIELIADVNVAYTEKAFRITFIKNDIIYSAEFKGQLTDKTGFFKVQTRFPIPEYPALEIYAEYDFTSHVKTVDINLKGENILFSVASKIEGNNVEINITTPVTGYEDLRMNGDYRTNGNQHSVTASFLKNGRTYVFHAEGTLANNTFTFNLSTPIPPIQNIIFMGGYDLYSQGVEGLMHFERNSDVFKFKIRGIFTPLQSGLTVAINTPVDGLNKLIFDIMYDFTSAEKSARISIQKDAFSKTISIKGNYSLDNGSFQIETPIEGFEVLGAEYNLSLDKIKKKLDANVKITQNSEERIFSAYGQYGKDNIIISFQTPFEEFDTITVKGSIDSDAMYGKSVIQFGSRKFSVNVSYSPDNMFLELETPFEDFKYVHVSAAFKWNARQRDGTLTFVHNENKYMINGVLTISPRTSGITFQATTPIQNYRNVSMRIKYDLDNRDELIAAQLTVREHSCHFIIGGYIEENRAKFNLDFVPPIEVIEGWTNVKFAASADFTQENKVLEISLANDENVKAIAISGKLVGSTVGFNLKSPIPGLHNLNVNASLNRGRRSLAVEMTNDVAEASLLTSFHSVSLHLKTPFERAEEISWNIQKIGNDSYTGEWRRNDNFIKFSVERNSIKPSFSVEVNSELQGWEYLALSGMLDQDTLEAYASGAINENKISISLTGTHSYRGKFAFQMTTPYDGYRTVKGEFTYKLRKKSLKLNVRSEDSNFRCRLNFDKDTGLQSELVVPNPVEDTVLNVQVGPFNGSITFTSRFEALRSYHQEYKTEISETMLQVKASHTIKVNGQIVFTLEAEGDRLQEKLHLMLHTYGSDFHRTLHIHREGLTTINFSLTCDETTNGVSTKKEFSLAMTGTGDLPIHGTADIVIKNSFIQPPTTSNLHIEVDRRRERKTITIEVVPRQNTVYAIDIEYSINLEEPEMGDFNIRVTDPDQKTSSISSTWNVENLEAADLSLMINGKKFNAHGKLGLYESTIVLTSESNEESVFLQWRVMNDGENIDYFLKIGPPSAYAMFKLKGNITDISHVDIEGGFKAGPFQENEFLFQSKWDIENDNSFTYSGSFEYGQYRGIHSLEEHHRNAAKSATFKWTASSNIPDYENISVVGNYDVDGKLVFAADITANNTLSNININLSNLQPLHSLNTIEFHIPILNEFAEFQLKLAHNFSSNADKYIAAVAKMGESESHARVSWDQSELHKFEGTIDIKSIFIGEIFIKAKYDITDINKAHAEVNYSRTDTGETLKIKWTKIRDSSHFENKVAVESSIEGVANATVFSSVDFTDGFKLTFLLEWGDQKITTFLVIGESSISCKITTPFENFESTEGKVEYSQKNNSKTLNVNYKRGSRNFTVAANLKPMDGDKGKIRIKISTPFEEIKKMVVKGEWESNTFRGKMKKDDDEYSITSDIDFQTGKTGFDVSLKTPENNVIRIAASYDVKDFLDGTGTDVQKIASLVLELPTHTMKFNMDGLRNNDRVYIEIDGEIALDVRQKIHIELNSERNAEVRHGTFVLILNDFLFRIRNSLHSYENNEYYFKSEFESTVTPLPALVFGLGYRNEEHILTVGYGKEKELTFSVKGKENFKSGFSGFVDIPHYGYKGVKYDVDYRFEGDNQLQINLVVTLDEDGNRVEANFVYDSEGVKARLISPFTGDHSMRVRRSVSSDGFFTEAGVDEYNLKLRGQFKDEDITRGAILEGDIFGKKFLIDFLFQSEGLRYSEGKLIIQTPFWGMEKMGGLFTWSNEYNKVIAHAEVLLPFSETPKLTGEINIDMNKKFDGFVKIDVAGQLFTLKSNLTGVSLSQGYQGKVELHTPFYHLSSVVINGNIRMDALSFLQADLKIVEPYNTHVMQLKYELRPEMLTATLSLHSRGSYGGIKSTFTLEGLGTTDKKIQLTINNDKLTLEYILRESTFKLMLDSLIMSVHRQFYVEANYPSLENMEASLAVVNLAGQTHRVTGKLNVVNNRVQGGIELSSTLIERTPKIDFDISVPNDSYEYIAFDVALTAYETHSIYFKLNARTGMNFTVKIDTPVFPKITATSELTTTSFRLVIETPTGTHAAYATWRGTLKMPIDCLTNVELMSPLLNDKYIFNVMLNGNTAKTMAKVQLRAGSVLHVLEASTSMTTNQGGFVLNIDTPFKNINKATLEASLEFRDKVQIQLIAKLAEKINKFNLVFDKENQTFLTVVESPFIPTGKAVAEAALTGSMKRNMKLQMTLRNAEEAFSGILNAKVSSPEAIQIRLRVATPFTGYKRMNFQAQYTRDDVTSIILNLDKPFNFKVNVNFSNTHDALQGKLSMETSIEDFKNIEVELDIPLYKFAPKAFLTLPSHKYGFTADFKRDVFSQMSVYLYLDDASYGGNIGLRTRAPYELAYGYNLADMMKSKFHLRTDSSFFSAFV